MLCKIKYLVVRYEQRQHSLNPLEKSGDAPGCLEPLNVKALSLFFFRAALAAYGVSQARGLIRATAAGLRHNHSNLGSEPRLQPTPQFKSTSDP